MLEVSIQDGSVKIGERFSVSLQRTLRIPDDGKVYPLPPGLGALPLFPVKDYGERVPDAWRERGGVFTPVHQREALWLGFDGAQWKPNAVKIGVGRINAVSGAAWDEALHLDPQDYIVCPDQPWLDGINAGDGYIRQFVAMPLGKGYSVEAQLTGAEEFGGIQILVFEPVHGKFPDEPPPEPARPRGLPARQKRMSRNEGELSLAAGGRMRQKIYPDPYGPETWDEMNRGSLFIHLVNSEQHRRLTGREPPPTPVSAKTYTDYGLPWFELYDEEADDLPASERLGSVKSVSEIETERGIAEEDDLIDVPETQLEKLTRSRFDDE